MQNYQRQSRIRQLYERFLDNPVVRFYHIALGVMVGTVLLGFGLWLIWSMSVPVFLSIFLTFLWVCVVVTEIAVSVSLGVSGKKGFGYRLMFFQFGEKRKSQAQKEDVYELIKELEEAYRRGELDPEAYEDKREKLLEKLE